MKHVNEEERLVYIVIVFVIMTKLVMSVIQVCVLQVNNYYSYHLRHPNRYTIFYEWPKCCVTVVCLMTSGEDVCSVCSVFPSLLCLGVGIVYMLVRMCIPVTLTSSL